MADKLLLGETTADLISKLNALIDEFNNQTGYTLPLATSSTRGGIKIGYSASGANIPLKLSSEKGYVTLTSSAVTNALGYTPLEKTTYEKSAELACGSNGKVCLGKFGAYDTNITIELNSTTSKTYHATIVIHSQNVVANGTGGTVGCYIYDDADNNITPLITVFRPYGSASRQIEVYANLPGWSKNLVHVQAVALSTGGMTDVLTSVDTIPTAIDGKIEITPVNVLTNSFLGKTAKASDSDKLDGHDSSYYATTTDTTNMQNVFNTFVEELMAGNVDVGYASEAGSVAWSNVTGKPSSYYTLPTAGSTLGGVKTTSTVTSTSGLTACPIIDGVPYYKDTNTTSLPTRLAEYSTSGYNDANDATPQGWHYMSSTATNRPPFKQVDSLTGSDYRIMTTAYGTTWLQQIATDFRSNDIFTRRKQNGTWQGWTALVKMQQGLASPVGTNNAIARWDSSRNATIKDSNVTIDDNGNLTIASGADILLNSGKISLLDKLQTYDDTFEDIEIELQDLNDKKASNANNPNLSYYATDNGTTTAGTWIAKCDNVTSLFDGLSVKYKVTVAGASTTTFNLNGLGAKTVYLRGTTKLTTHYAVDTMLHLIYSASTEAWYVADYDTNSYTLRVYRQTSGYNADYPIFVSRTATSGIGTAGSNSTYTNVYGVIAGDGANTPTINPHTGALKATSFVENGAALSSKYLGKDSVSFTQTLTSGTEIGSITINGSEKKIYAPESSGSGSTSSVPLYNVVFMATASKGTTTVSNLRITLTVPSSALSNITSLATLRSYLLGRGYTGTLSNGFAHGCPCGGALTNNQTVLYSAHQIFGESSGTYVFVELRNTEGIGEFYQLNGFTRVNAVAIQSS